MASLMVNHNLPIRAIAVMSLTFRNLFFSTANVKVGETYSHYLKTTFPLLYCTGIQCLQTHKHSIGNFISFGRNSILNKASHIWF